MQDHIPVDEPRLVRDLRALGVERGDHVVVVAALRSLGVERGAGPLLIAALRAAVGDAGSVYGLSFTPIFRLPLWGAGTRYVFDPDAPAVTGGYANALLKTPGAYRSPHPTMSFVGVGDHARDVLRNHTAESRAFEPIASLAGDSHGKMLLVGIVQSSPGISTAHLAQDMLGFRNRCVGRYGVRFRHEDGTIRLYVQNYGAGCSLGFGRFYDAYRAHDAVREGPIGDSDCMLATLERTLPVELEILRRDPTFFFCADLGCRSCRRDWTFYREPLWSYAPHRAIRIARAVEGRLRMKLSRHAVRAPPG